MLVQDQVGAGLLVVMLLSMCFCSGLLNLKKQFVFYASFHHDLVRLRRARACARAPQLQSRRRPRIH